MKQYVELEMKIVVLMQEDIITSSPTTNPSLSNPDWNDYDDTIGDFFG